MPIMNVVQAVNNALREEMRRDERVVIFGEDVGRNGGVFRCTDGLIDEFPDRVYDTPLSESGIVAAAIGMALYGLRPVPEIQFSDFIYPAFDQIISETAKYRYRSGGQFSIPLVVRSPYGGGIRGGHYHSQSPEVYFAHTAGLNVVVPSGPYDAKGLLLASIRNPDPVIFLEPKKIYRKVKEEVPEGDYTVPLGQPKLLREGDSVSLISYGYMAGVSLEAAQLVEREGISCDVVDLRTLSPLNPDPILASVRKTGRVVIAYEAPKFCGYGAEIAAMIAEEAVDTLEGPVVRVAGFDTPFPYALEEYYMPGPERVARGIRRVMSF